MTDATIDAIAERLLREASEAITTPHESECLQCFVARMLDAFGCDGTWRFARRYGELRAPRATAWETALAAVGGLCDCGIFVHGWWIRPPTPPSAAGPVVGAAHAAAVAAVGAPDLPTCSSVRPGSVRPCDGWVRRSRPRW